MEGARGATAREAFGQRLVALLPELRKHAVFLARDRAAAEDLVQGAAANAMAAWERFEPGTNFAGWMHRILRNLFLYERRRWGREACGIDDLPEEALPSEDPWTRRATPEGRLALRDLSRALARLPGDQRRALLLVAAGALPYEDAARVAGCGVGTMKTRVFRARRKLGAWLPDG